jgi:hypothetical protein
MSKQAGDSPLSFAETGSALIEALSAKVAIPLRRFLKRQNTNGQCEKGPAIADSWSGDCRQGASRKGPAIADWHFVHIKLENDSGPAARRRSPGT